MYFDRKADHLHEAVADSHSNAAKADEKKTQKPKPKDDGAEKKKPKDADDDEEKPKADSTDKKSTDSKTPAKKGIGTCYAELIDLENLEKRKNFKLFKHAVVVVKHKSSEGNK